MISEEMILEESKFVWWNYNRKDVFEEFFNELWEKSTIENKKIMIEILENL